MKKIFAIGLIGATLTMGCKKENNEGDPPSGSSKYLKSFVTTTDGESVTYVLTYDNRKRLVGYSSEQDDYRSKITYNNQDNPTRFELESENQTQVFEITYNAAGIPVSATSTLTDAEQPEEPIETEIVYEVANGKISKMHFTDETGHETTYTLSYTGTNLTKVALATAEGNLELTWKYGTKKSPFSAVRFKYLVIPDLFSVFSGENELIESKLELLGIGSATSTFSYVYDAAGYPTSATETDEDGNVSTMTYQYQ